MQAVPTLAVKAVPTPAVPTLAALAVQRLSLTAVAKPRAAVLGHFRTCLLVCGHAALAKRLVQLPAANQVVAAKLLKQAAAAKAKR